MPAPVTPFAKLAGELPDMLPHMDASEAARPIVEAAETPTDALAALLAAALPLDAVRLLSHALPKREAVWWACMCARHTEPGDLAELDRSAREATEAWVRKPTDENRRAAFEYAQEAGFQTPEAWCACGAFWSGDSMAPVKQPVVAPPAGLPGKAVAGSVVLSSVRGDGARQAARLQTFLASGQEIAAGGTGRLDPEEP